MSDTITYGSHEFEVDLGQLSDAIGSVGAQRDAIRTAFEQIKSHFSDVGAMWFGPAGQSFRDFDSTLQTAAQDTLDVLDDIVNRLGTAYQNYSDAEATNVGNLTSDNGNGNGNGNGDGDVSHTALQPDSKVSAAVSDPVPLTLLDARQPSQ